MERAAGQRVRQVPLGNRRDRPVKPPVARGDRAALEHPGQRFAVARRCPAHADQLVCPRPGRAFPVELRRPHAADADRPGPTRAGPAWSTARRPGAESVPGHSWSWCADRVRDRDDASVHQVTANRGGQFDGPLDAGGADPLDGACGEPVGQVLNLPAQRAAGLGEATAGVEQAAGHQATESPSQSSSVQPRVDRTSARGMARVAAKVTVASSPRSPWATPARTRPSPRCSRSTVAASHSAPTGSSGTGHAGPRRGQRASVKPAAFHRFPQQVRELADGREQGGVDMMPECFRRALQAGFLARLPVRASFQASGTALATMLGANPYVIASTAGAGSGPRGATRLAK